LVYLFSRENGPAGTPGDVKGWGLLLAMFFSEHIYLAVKLGVHTALGKIDSAGLQKERADRYIVKK
jgi:anoctamin-10